MDTRFHHKSIIFLSRKKFSSMGIPESKEALFVSRTFDPQLLGFIFDIDFSKNCGTAILCVSIKVSY